MASGKYAAVSGMTARMRMMDNIAEHLAAAKTYSYKKGMKTFDAYLAEANSGMATKAANQVQTSKEEYIDFSPGELEYSGNPLHVAINGDGFFQVLKDDGSTAYTRKGNFKMNPEGILVDSHDRQVLSTEGGPITLPNPNVAIGSDGSIWDEGTQVGQIAVYKFEDNSVLKRSGEALFVPEDGVQPVLNPTPEVAANNLETSNVDIMQTTVRMTANLRTFEATQKALSVYNAMDEKSADLGIIQ